MKSKIITILMVWLLSANAAQAALSGNGNGLVYDSLLNVTWSSDANLLGTMLASDPSLVSKIVAAVPAASAGNFGAGGVADWFGAQAFVGYLNSSRYLGQNAWSLPTADPACASGYNCTTSPLGELFYTGLGGVAGTSIGSSHNSSYSLFTNVQSGYYWSNALYAPNPTIAWGFDTSVGRQLGGTRSYNGFYSWVMLPGNVVAPVPEPGEWAMMLAGFGLIGGIAKRRKLV